MEPANLRTLIELATTSRDAAATRRAHTAQQLEQARTQMSTLLGYMTEYQRRVQNTLSVGCDMAAQNNLRAFVIKLERAVEQQSVEIKHREQMLAAADEEFNKMQRKVKSLETLQTRREEDARLVAQRRDQKNMDEMAQSRSQLNATRGGQLSALGW